jgi:hypothetical protein
MKQLAANLATARRTMANPRGFATFTCLSMTITFLILFPFLHAPYFGDDLEVFFALDPPSHLWEYFLHFQTGVMDHAYRPIEAVLLTLIQQHFWLNTVPIHLISIAAHACLCGMTAFLGFRLGMKCREVVLAALLVTISPEMATTLLGNDCMSQALSGMFSLLSIVLAYEAYERRDTHAAPLVIGLWLLGALAYALSIFSKETGLGNIVGIALIAALMSRRQAGLRKVIYSITKLLSPYVVAALLYFAARQHAGIPLRAREPVYQIHFGSNMIANVVVFVIGALSPVSSLRTSVASQTHDRPTLLLFGGLLLLTMLTLAAGVYLSKRKTLYLFLLILALAALFPAIALVHVSELYLYSAVPYFALLAAAAFADIWKYTRAMRILAAASMAIMLLGLIDGNYQKARCMDASGKDSTMMMMAIGYYARTLPADGTIVLLDHKHNRPSYSIYLSDQELENLEIGQFNVAQFYTRLMGRPDVSVSICKDWLGCVPVQLPNEAVLQMRNGQLSQVYPRL